MTRCDANSVIWRGFNKAAVLGSLALAIVSTTGHVAYGTITTEAGLRSAIVTANSNNQDDTIYVSGTITLMSFGTGEDACASGDLDVTEQGFRLTIIGQGVGSTTIEGYEAFFSDRLFHVLSGAELTLQDIYLKSPKSGGLTVLGDSLRNQGGDLVLERCTLQGTNAYNYSGGGIHNSGTLTVMDSTITTCKGASGIYNTSTGAAYVESTTVTDNTDSAIKNIGGSLECLDCTFTTNTGYWGGAIYNEEGTVELELCLFDANVAGGGGAITNKDGDLYATSCEFTGQVDTSGEGGAIKCLVNTGFSIYMLFDDCEFTGNEAASGGALYITAGPMATVLVEFQNGCWIAENEADQMAAGLAVGTSTGSATVHLGDTVIEDNVAGVYAGGVWNCGSTVTGGTITNNTPNNVYNGCATSPPW
jgi:hypothetical protein